MHPDKKRVLVRRNTDRLFYDAEALCFPPRGLPPWLNRRESLDPIRPLLLCSPERTLVRPCRDLSRDSLYVQPRDSEDPLFRPSLRESGALCSTDPSLHRSTLFLSLFCLFLSLSIADLLLQIEE